MKAHITKNEFNFVSISVMVLEVAAFLVFVFGTLGAILGTYLDISTTDFIILGFGGIFISLVLMAVAEVLQIMMRIEYNTRKENTLLAAQMKVQKEEVEATKKVAAAIRKPRKVTTAKRTAKRDVRRGVTRRTTKRAAVKKVKAKVKSR